ncbi:MAG: fatty acid--CoA ligase family protein [Verrucomicrobiota bacterium]
MEQRRCQSLYRQWRTVADRHAADFAVEDTLSGRVWTFRDLAEWAESLPPAAGEVLAASGRGLEFAGQVLRAWRDGAVLVPAEEAAPGPDLAGMADLPDTIGHVKTTSGSTGTPRQVLMTPGQLAADAGQIVSTMGLRRGWPNVAAISLAHSYGFSSLVLPLLLHGIPLVLMESPLPDALRRVLARYPAVTVPAVPALWRAWQGAGVIDSRVKLAISAGAPLTLELEKAVFDATGVKIHNFYGSSECGGIAYDRTPVPRADSRMAGTAMDGVRLRVNDTTGVLEVGSAGVAEGYAVPDGALRDQVFTTPDLAEIEADGTVFLLGRTGESILVAGRKIAPASVEEKLLSLPGVRHCVVFGVPSPDPARVEEIVAGLHLDPGFHLESLRAAAARALPSGQQPRHWFSDGTLRPDVRGKISRAAWRSWWLERRAAADR